MPRNKNAEQRYRILDRCFSDFTKKYSYTDLEALVNQKIVESGRDEYISTRQLRDDISEIRKMIQDADVELIAYYDYTDELTRKKHYYYRYTREDFSIYNNELSDSELQNLRSTLTMLSRFKCSNPWLEEVISSLEVKFEYKGRSENLISFGQNEYLLGIKYLSPIIDATINHHPLEFGYTTARGAEHKYVLHPYYVKQYNGRWFVFGWDDENKRITNLAIDRILSLTKSNRKFINNTVIDFNNYFDKIIGVTMPNDLTEDPVQIELKFSPDRFKYVVSKPLHPLQNTIESECKVVLNLYPNKELKQQIFSFGADVEVLSPKELREEIKQEIEKCLKLYSTMQKECTSVE